MKRYRVLPFFDFDTRVLTLTLPIRVEWEEDIKNQHYENRKKTIEGLIAEYGEIDSAKKIENFIALNIKPFSILAFHNRFFSQAWNAFIIGAYYPALTGVCALGERILNHLMLLLRDDYKNTPEYKKVYGKASFDDWSLPIKTLQSWDVLLPDVVENFYQLKDMRHKAIHFRPETDHNDRELALQALHCMKAIIGSQFSGWGSQPWFTITMGELYIKKAWEEKPFIKKVYLPNCALVGPKHRIAALMPKVVIDDIEYEPIEITDEEFCRLRNES
jgi:hypothetical protein